MKKLLEELINKEKNYLDDFFSRIDLKALENILETLFHTQGMIIVTGVGKSGLIAKKIAVTMTSTGTKALYLSPTDALHGDLGIANQGDIVLILSKSGESDELVTLVPFLRNRGVKIISLVSKKDSRLGKASDFNLELPFSHELCPFDMAPTISTVCQTIIGDILTVALMRLKKFTLSEYAKAHPAGRIGKRITVKVQDLMLKGTALPLARPSDILVDQLVTLSDKRCGCLLVVDAKETLLGIFTDGDLRRALQNFGSKALEKPLEELMIRSPRYTHPDELAWKALESMESDQRHPVMVLPVLDQGKVVGLIKMHDIVQAGI